MLVSGKNIVLKITATYIPSLFMCDRNISLIGTKVKLIYTFVVYTLVARVVET